MRLLEGVRPLRKRALRKGGSVMTRRIRGPTAEYSANILTSSVNLATDSTPAVRGNPSWNGDNIGGGVVDVASKNW